MLSTDRELISTHLADLVLLTLCEAKTVILLIPDEDAEIQAL